MAHRDSYRVTLADIDGEPVVLLAGEIDTTAEADLHRVIEQARRPGRRLVIDLSETTFIDSGGLRVLVQAWQAQTDAGLETVFLRPSPAVCRVMELWGMSEVTDIDRTDHKRPRHDG